ncbi:MAG: pirin family protein [Bacteroidota bacterium]
MMISTQNNFSIHRADSRGQADHGWLQARFSFSFASFYDPERIQFGMIRVMNDDRIAGGKGFGMHPHDNMEIITIPLSGALAHQDNMGNEGIIKAGDVQVMSAGTGVMHSEFNPQAEEETRLFQIWIFPNQLNVSPRYEQLSFAPELRKNQFQYLVAPHHREEGGLWIHQNAYISRIDMEREFQASYQVHGAHQGVYLMNIEGAVEVNGNHLAKRDALAIQSIEHFEIKAQEASQLLLIETPLSHH